MTNLAHLSTYGILLSFIRYFSPYTFKYLVRACPVHAAVAQPGTARVSNFKELTRFRKDFPVQIRAAAYHHFGRQEPFTTIF